MTNVTLDLVPPGILGNCTCRKGLNESYAPDGALMPASCQDYRPLVQPSKYSAPVLGQNETAALRVEGAGNLTLRAVQIRYSSLSGGRCVEVAALDKDIDPYQQQFVLLGEPAHCTDVSLTTP